MKRHPIRDHSCLQIYFNILYVKFRVDPTVGSSRIANRIIKSTDKLLRLSYKVTKPNLKPPMSLDILYDIACKFLRRSNGRISVNHQPVNSIDIYHFSLFIDPNENMLIIYQNDRINEHIPAQILDWPVTAARAATVGGRR